MQSDEPIGLGQVAVATGQVARLTHASARWAVLAQVDNARIERIYPLEGNPPRLERASSSRAFRSTYFEVSVDYDREDHGRAQVAQGYLKIINNSVY